MYMLSVLWVVALGCASLSAQADSLLRDVRDQAMQLIPLTPKEKILVAQQAFYMMNVRKLHIAIEEFKLDMMTHLTPFH
jgi:hypothetical protein